MPISNLCRANISWNSTSNCSIFSSSSEVRVEYFQSKFSRNFAQDSSSWVGSSVSRSCKACNSRRIRFWISVCSSGFPGFSGVGNQYFSNFEDFYLSWWGCWRNGLPALSHFAKGARLLPGLPVWHTSSVLASWLRNWQCEVLFWACKGGLWNCSQVSIYCHRSEWPKLGKMCCRLLHVEGRLVVESQWRHSRGTSRNWF